MESSSNILGQIRSSFERIFKGIISKLYDGEEKYVCTELQWIDKKINDLFNLSKRDFEKFRSIIDPRNRFIYNDPVDFSNINWSEVKFVRGSSSSDTINELLTDLRQYKLAQVDYSDNFDITDLLLSSCSKVWMESVKLSYHSSANLALYTIGNLYSNIALRQSTRMDFNKVFLDLTQRINNQILRISKKKDVKTNNTLIWYLSCQFHLTHFQHTDFSEPRFETLRAQMFLSLKLSIDKDNIEIIKNFIRSLNGGAFYVPSVNNYTELYSLIDTKYKELGTTDDVSLKKIPEYGLWGPQFCFTKEEYTALNTGLDELLNHFLDQIKDDASVKLVKMHIYELKLFTLNRYKYRLIQRSLVITLVYAIFKGEFKLVDEAFSYNQPPDASAIWSNRDIIPGELGEILAILCLRHLLDNELMFSLPDHHGALPYIDQFYLKSLRNWLDRKSEGYPSEAAEIAKNFSRREEFKRNPGILEGLIYTLKNLQQTSTYLIEHKKFPFQETDISKNEQLEKLFNSLIDELQSGLAHIERREAIKIERIKSFTDKILEQFQRKAFYRKLISRQTGQPVQEIANEVKQVNFYTLGFNELIDRSIFLENWHIPTYGMIEYVGNQLAEQEDFNIERGIDDLLGKGNRIKGKDISELLSRANPNELMVFKNYLVEYQIAKENDFVPKWKSKEFEDEDAVIGKYKESIVYTYRGFGLDKLIFLNKNLGQLTEGSGDKYTSYEKSKDFYIKTIDFGTEDEQLSKFLAAPPNWLTQRYPTAKEQEEYLSKKVWLRIYGTFRWSIPDKFSGTEYIIEETNYY